MKKTFYYDFNEYYFEGCASIEVLAENYPYEVEITPDVENLSDDQLKRLYRTDALKAAAYDTTCNYSDMIYGGY